MLCYSSPTVEEVDIATKKNRGVVAPARSNSARYSSVKSQHFDGGHVILTQPDGRALYQPAPPRTTNYIGLAVVVLLCFNLPFGIVAVFLSVKSNKDFEAGNMEAGRYKGRLSMIVSATGIVITLTTIMLAIFWPVIVRRPKDEP